MERSRRVGVRSIYARDESGGKADGGGGDTTPPPHDAPRTTSRPTKSETGSPEKKAPKRAPSTGGPPAKRGRPPKLQHAIKAHLPLDDNDDMEEEVVDANDESMHLEPQEPAPVLEMHSSMPTYNRAHLLGSALAKKGRPVREHMTYDETNVIPHVPRGGSSTSATQFSLYSMDIVNEFHEPGIITTEHGDKFLKLREGALGPLLKREAILSLIVNDTERTEHHGWVNPHSPQVPPLTEDIACFVCFVNTKEIDDPKYLTTDGLSPWSSSHPCGESGNATPTRPKVRKWAANMRGGEYCISGDDWRNALYVLVEYSATLPRCPRLRKRVYYMMRDRMMLGLAMLVYDYTEPGVKPAVIANGFRAQRVLSNRFAQPRLYERDDYGGLEDPSSTSNRERLSSLLDPTYYDDEAEFESVDGIDYLEGSEHYDSRDGPFIGDRVLSSYRIPDHFVRVCKSNWTSDKTLLLKYIINDTASIPSFAINSSKPHMPPLISSIGCFAAFLKGSDVINHTALNTDLLSPWTSQTIRPKTRKLPLEQISSGAGEYVQIARGKDWRSSSLVLVETCTKLARCPRLRKRVYYVMRNNLTIIGYVLFLYEFLEEGDPPAIVGTTGRPIESLSSQRSTLSHSHSTLAYHDTLATRIARAEASLEDSMDLDVGGEIEVGGDEHDLSLDDEGDDTLEEEEDGESIDGGGGVELTEEEEWRKWSESGGIVADIFEAANQRCTAMGDRYVCAKSRQLIADKNNVLAFIVNDQRYAYDRGLVLPSKPFLPPLSSQQGIFVFFCSPDNFEIRQANKDGLSPWSSAEDPESSARPIRSKVKKYALTRELRRKADGDGTEGDDTEFRVAKGAAWRESRYVLVQMHSVLPRCPRLHKKIYYVLDTAGEGGGTGDNVLGNIMIVYEYIEAGEAPKVVDRIPRRTRRRPALDLPHDQHNDVPIDYDMNDMDDLDRDCPFDFEAHDHSRDAMVYVPIVDPSFLTNRDKQLYYCVNKAHAIARLGFINSAVPLFPPLTSQKGDFCFFVDGEGMDPRNLTCDGLAPWSDSRMQSATRPKSRKLPVEKTRDGMLRYVGGSRWETTPYYLVVYYAVLPRCPRLKKRILYACNADNHIIGNVLVIYSYTEDGSIPQQVAHGNSSSTMTPFFRVPPSLRDEAKKLLQERRPSEVHAALGERSPAISTRSIYNISKSMRGPGTRNPIRRPGQFGVYKDEYEDGWADDQLADIMPSSRMGMGGDRRRGLDAGEYFDATGEPYIDVVADGSMEVAHSEEIAASSERAMGGGGLRGPKGLLSGRLGLMGRVRPQMRPGMEARNRLRIVQYVMQTIAAATEDEAHDYLWRTLLERNEQRVLDNIRRDFGVEIVTNDEQELQEMVIEQGEIPEQVMALQMHSGVPPISEVKPPGEDPGAMPEQVMEEHDEEAIAEIADQSLDEHAVPSVGEEHIEVEIP